MRYQHTLRPPACRFACALALWVISSIVIAEETPQVAVRYLSAETVYLDAGRSAGLAAGDQLELERDGRRVARLEVTFVAQYSASCRVLESELAIEIGDRVRAGAWSAEDRVRPTLNAPEETPAQAPSEGAIEAASAPKPYTYTPKTAAVERTTRASGSILFDWESLDDATDRRLGYSRTGVRLDLRLRDLGGLPLELRARMRRREIDRDRLLNDLPSEAENQNRFYELSLTYEPPSQRFGLSIGRLGGAAAALGRLDGVLGYVGSANGFRVGGFAGADPNLEDFSVTTANSKYGVFGEYAPPPGPAGRRLSLLAAGVREEGEIDISRDYVAMRLAYSGPSRWSFYQLAEIDIHNGWRSEVEDASAQLSRLSLSLSGRLGDSTRLSLSYDRTERYRTEETRFLADELFDDVLRQGLRARLTYRRASGASAWLFAGVRDADGSRAATVSYGLGLADPRIGLWGLGLSANLLGYTSDLTEGFIATSRLDRSFVGGHQLSLTLGGRLSENRLLGGNGDVVGWLRLQGWIEFSHGLFGIAGYELQAGDEVDDSLTSLSLGYRF